MDKGKAIKFFKKSLSEIPHLAKSSYDNHDYPLWRDTIEGILEAVFGRDSSEYQNFSKAQSYVSHPGENHQKTYLWVLKRRETALKSIIRKYEVLGIETKPAAVEESVAVVDQPKAFIVHGGKSGVLEKLREFVEALGLKPLIVEMLPSKGMTVADKVQKYQQEADCAIILATRGGIIDTKSGKQHPRLNVIDELSSFWEAFPERVIVLLEKVAELPSNKSGLTYEPFARQSMDRAFIAIARELTEMKILKVLKP